MVAVDPLNSAREFKDKPTALVKNQNPFHRSSLLAFAVDALEAAMVLNPTASVKQNTLDRSEPLSSLVQ